MKRTTVKVLIVLLLILDGILFALVFGPELLHKQEQPALQATEAFAPAEPAVRETTLPQESSVPETTLPPQTQTTQATLPEERFLLTFVGDCTFGSSPATYYADLGFVKTVGDDLGYPFRNVHTYFEEDEFSMVNFEGVLAERGAPIPKSYNFRGPVKYAKILSQGSIEAVTLANNHSFDYGKMGYASTLAALEEEDVPYVERDDILLLTTKNGLKIGIYAMTYAGLDMDDMLQGIADLQTQGAEVIIVAAHWGIENHYTPEDKQVEFGHAAIDVGAHIVYGSHPHVLQPVEVYGNGIIYYSLGNFAFGGNGAPTDMDSVIVRQEVIRKGDGTVVLGQLDLVPVCVSSVADKNNFQPTPYKEDSEEYRRVLAKLEGIWE